MAFSDPQSVTVSGTAISLPRTSSGTNAGGFTSNDGNNKLSVSHSYGKRTRRQIRLDFQKIAADPLTSANTRFTGSVYLVVDQPIVGYSVTELQAQIAGFLASLTTAQQTKLLGGEN